MLTQKVYINIHIRTAAIILSAFPPHPPLVKHKRPMAPHLTTEHLLLNGVMQHYGERQSF